MEKSPEAFRTISEVAEWLEVPTHVLRFWESRFAQVKPVKRAGGRRYYRPSDMRLIGGIKKLLHEDGMTIRGVQKLLREEGVKHVASFSRPLDSEADAIEDAAPVVSFRHAGTEATTTETSTQSDPVSQPQETLEPVDAFEPQDVDDEPVEPQVAAEPPVEVPAEGDTVAQFGSVREDDDIPELPFLGSARDHPRPVSMDPAEAPAPSIPLTPDVPEADPDDDAPAHATGPGPGARLIAARDRGLIDVGALSEAAEALRAVRDRVAS